MISKIRKELNDLGSKERATHLMRFFRTGKGEYGEGDIFLGLTVPEQRMIAKKYLDMDLREIAVLLQSKIHEHRLTALIILTEKFKRAVEKDKKAIFNLYLKNTKHINNWDLVDLSSHKIVGQYLFDKDRKILYKLAQSKMLWERRIAIVATWVFISKNDLADTFKLAEILLMDDQDLMHKAVGWMLREAGKKDLKSLYMFLDKSVLVMPRTMLRYSIERLEEEKRLYYLNFGK